MVIACQCTGESVISSAATKAQLIVFDSPVGNVNSMTESIIKSLSPQTLTSPATIPGIFAKLDGISTHSYPNPAFSSSPKYASTNGINSFKYEQDLIKDLLYISFYLHVC